MIGIILLLHVDFRSWRLTALVFLTIPFALYGGVAGVMLDNGIISLGSLVGFNRRCWVSRLATASCWSATTGIWKNTRANRLVRHWSSRFQKSGLRPILPDGSGNGIWLLSLLVWGGNLPRDVKSNTRWPSSFWADS